MVTGSLGQIDAWIAFLAQRDCRRFQGTAECDGGTTPLPRASPPNGFLCSTFQKTLRASRSKSCRRWSLEYE